MDSASPSNTLSILSARSFLGLAEHPSASSSLGSQPSRHNAEKVDALTKEASQLESDSESESNSKSPSTMKTRLRSKSAGRPRLQPGSAAVLSEDRRKQIRRAQRTYRLKKEAAIRNTRARIEDLEARVRRASEGFGELYQAATEADLHVSHPDVFSLLERVRESLTSKKEPDGLFDTSKVLREEVSKSESKGVGPHCTLGYQLEEPDSSTTDDLHETQLESLPLALTNHRYTYSLQETRFSRRLQRYCLEHSYRLFTDPRSPPREIYRVFRLVPCIQDKEKTQPRFQQLLTGGCRDPLEVPGLPFYSVGGAGTHYPDVDESGNLVYPANRRMPRRVLSILPDAEPKEEPGLSRNRDRILDICGLGGQWFDSRDVEGYLRVHGVDVRNPCLFPPVRGKGLPADIHYVLDVEGFLNRLLRGLVILGRAPGFRKVDVMAALRMSIRVENGT